MDLGTIGVILFIVLTITHGVAYSIGHENAYKEYFGAKWEQAQLEVQEWNRRNN